MSSVEIPQNLLPAGTLGARFRVRSELRASLGVRELRGTDLSTGRPVVIGAVAGAAATVELRARLQAERERLRMLAGPRLSPLAHVGAEHELVFAVRPDVGGMTLAQRLELSGPLGLIAALTLATDVLAALELMHGAGVLHLDVHADAVMLDHLGGRGVLTYLGLARGVPLGPDELSPRDVRHLSPEQAGLVRTELDVRSDLYSVGVLLYEALAGVAPFAGATVNEVLRQHLAPPPDILRQRLDVPVGAQAVLGRLLAPRPQDRYPSAAEAAADLHPIVAALKRGVEPPVPASPRQRDHLAPPRFVGRERELARLSAAAAAAAAGCGGLLLLEAVSGGGKSAVLDQFAHRAQECGAWVLRGQGVDRVADRPYQALAGVVEAVRERGEREPRFAAELRRRLGGMAAPLVAALPQLRSVLRSNGAPVAEAAEAAHGPALTRRAIAALLDALGGSGDPAVVLLDDVQWADELSLELLGEWASNEHRPPQHQTLVVAAFRSEEVVAPGHPLRSMVTLDQIHLETFGGEEIAQVVESMAGTLPPGLVELALSASEGLPFMTVELIRGLVETGILRREGGEWSLDVERLPDTQTSGRVAEIAAARVEQLPPDVLEVLSVAAVLGKHFAVEPLADLADRGLPNVLSALEQARRRHIVWVEAGSGRWAFVHDKLRERLLSQLPDARRRQLHLEVAEHLQSDGADLVFDLAYHYDEAGRSEQAVPHALAAAADARRRFSLQIAERYYRIAERGIRDGESDAARQVQEGLGDVAMLRGQYADAEEHLRAAQQACREDRAQGVIEGKLGELAFKRGDVDDAAARLESGLRMLGRRVPGSSFGMLIQLVRELVVQILHTLFPRVFLGRRSLSASEDDLVAARLHSRLAHVYWFRSGRVPCAWTHLRGMNLVERYPPTPELAQAYSEHAPAITMVPYLSRGERYVRRSLALRRGFGDVWGEGQSLHFLGVVLYAGSRYSEALEALHEAVRLLERTGDQWEVSTARWHIALCLYRLGRLREAAEMSSEVHRVATAIGDTQARGIALGVWAKATGGGAPDELVDEALGAVGSDVHTGCEILQAHALRKLAAGEACAAVEALEHADRLVREAGLRQEYIAPVLPWLTTALRRQLQQQSLLDPQRRRLLLRKTMRTARRARRIARFYGNNLPHALREHGILYAMAGRPRRARALLQRSLGLAEAQGATYERALTRVALADLEATSGRPEAIERLQAMRGELAAMSPGGGASNRPRVTLSLADRFDTVLHSGRAIASALNRQAVFEAVQKAAVSLLRVDTCAVYELRNDALSCMAGTADNVATREAARRALTAGLPVSMHTIERPPGGAEDPQHVLVALVRERDGHEACVCASDEGLGVFAEEEERLAAFIAALAGAALENARGFAASEAQSRSLEQMVSERTAELNASYAEMEATLSLLAATLESTADGILVVDGNGRVVNHNGRFVEMWQIPSELIERRSDEVLLAFIGNQLVDSDGFLRRVREIYDAPESTSYDVLEFKDGRVFERFSKPQRVSGATAARVWSFHDLTQQKHSERELEHLANHDGLTGLLNRRRFEHELEQAIAGLRRRGGSAALLMIDLDNFKYVNDTLGHGAGDELIKDVASLLRGRLRQTDRIARLGGDEFAVLLGDVGPEDAHRIGMQLLIALRHHAVPIEGRSLSMTASIGVAIVDDGDAEVSQVLADADLAMYEAKRAGRDGISVSAPEQAREARLAARFSWGERLRRALEQDEFVLYAQPVLDLATNEVTTHEILLRLHGPGGEVVGPAQFLPGAERLGLMTAIDRWVVSRAIRLLAPWLRGDPQRRIEINLSGNSIGDAELPELIAAELETSSIDPKSLIFEVTETATIANMGEAKRFAAAISDLGCRFALDDFGTGFGSFYYLKHLPVDYLKIDGDFIADLPESETDQLIVKSIIDIARGTGKRTIAEFVSDRHILRQVRELGVDYAQGYYIGRPVPLDRID